MKVYYRKLLVLLVEETVVVERETEDMKEIEEGTTHTEIEIEIGIGIGVEIRGVDTMIIEIENMIRNAHITIEIVNRNVTSEGTIKSEVEETMMLEIEARIGSGVVNAIDEVIALEIEKTEMKEITEIGIEIGKEIWSEK